MEHRGKCKASKRPYMKLFTSDYRDGTVHLDFEAQGFYFRILTYLHDGQTVPAEAADLARFLQCNARTVRKLLPKLIAAGKLYQSGFELKNPRIERELEANSTPIQPEFDPNSAAKIQKDESNQVGSEPHHGEGHFHCHSQREEKQETPVSSSAAQPAKERKRGARLPDDWVLPSEWENWTLVNCPVSTPDAVQLEGVKFANYWQARSGREACKVDWFKTWKNRCLDVFGTAPTRSRPPAYTQPQSHLTRLLAKRRAEAEAVQ